MAKDTWLKLHTSLLLSQKYRNLPSNNHRLVFIHHLIFEKKGMAEDDSFLLAALCCLDVSHYKQIKVDLAGHGLLDERGHVQGFEDTQLTPEAIRQRRKRERDSNAKSNVICNGDSRKQKADSREKKEDEEERHTLSSSPKRTSTMDACHKIVSHLNQKAGTRFSPKNKSTVNLIKARIAEGRTVEDMMAVIDHKCAEWLSDANMVKYLRPSTLFNATKFESYFGQIGRKYVQGKDPNREVRPYDIEAIEEERWKEQMKQMEPIREGVNVDDLPF